MTYSKTLLIAAFAAAALFHRRPGRRFHHGPAIIMVMALRTQNAPSNYSHAAILTEI